MCVCIDINILNINKYIIYVICLYIYVYILCFLLYIIFLCLSRNGFSFQGYSYCFFNNDKLQLTLLQSYYSDSFIISTSFILALFVMQSSWIFIDLCLLMVLFLLLVLWLLPAIHWKKTLGDMMPSPFLYLFVIQWLIASCVPAVMLDAVPILLHFFLSFILDSFIAVS